MVAGKPERHRWVKLKEHKYLCSKCGTGKTNEELGPSYWQQRYALPNGKEIVSRHVPPCEPGPETDKRIEQFRARIEDALTWKPPF